MTPEDLLQAASDAQADEDELAAAGFAAGDLEAFVEAEPDPATDGLECAGPESAPEPHDDRG